MALFGKKKLSLDEILKGIAELSEEERAKVLSSMQGGDSAPAPDEGEQEAEETKEPVEETEEVAAESESVELEESSDGETEIPEQETESETEAEAEVEAGTGIEMEESLEETEPMTETPAESPQVEESAQGPNYEELLQAQTARIDSLESQVNELKGKLENVVANQDNQNFGYSPKANFDEDVQTSRRDAILQGYAPRRADQYK